MDPEKEWPEELERTREEGPDSDLLRDIRLEIEANMPPEEGED